MTNVDELIGKTLGGRFRLTRKIGQGGMGAVYTAVDTEAAGGVGAGRPEIVAVKVIKAHLVDDQDAVQRFQREARAVGGLNHPHIVGFVGAGDDDGVHWLAMELLDGTDLKERIASRGAIGWKDTLPILRQICLGLQAAHERGVVHRDLKPENVMLTKGAAPGDPPHVKILDFGIAKHIDVEGMTMTGTGVVVGTPGFVAPEVIVHGVTNDPRSDLYSLGVVWFEMLTATRPFSAPTPFALTMRHVQEAPPRPTSLLPFSPVPLPVEELVLRLMAKRPTDRPASAAELLALLDDLVRQAEQPPEPATSRVRTEADLLGGDKTETSLQVPPSTSVLPLPGPALGASLGPNEPTILDLQRPPATKSWKPALIVGAVAALGLLVSWGTVQAARQKHRPVAAVVDAGSAPPPGTPTFVPAAPIVDAGTVVQTHAADVVDAADAGSAAPRLKTKTPKPRPDDVTGPDAVLAAVAGSGSLRASSARACG